MLYRADNYTMQLERAIKLGHVLYICCSIREDKPSRFPTSHRLRTTVCRPIDHAVCTTFFFFFDFRRRRHLQDIPPSNRTGLSDNGSRNDSVKSSPNADNVLVHRRLDSLSLSRRLSAQDLGYSPRDEAGLYWPCRLNVSNNRSREREREGDAYVR